MSTELESVQEGVRATLDEVRLVASRLRPGALEDLGLISSLNALVTEFSRSGDVHIDREFTPGLPPLAPEVELVVYRVAQEALTNVSRHANARNVSISLTRRGDILSLRISDDGIGMSGETPGAGIRGMESRSKLVGGQLAVQARAGGGTQVQLNVPLLAP